MIGVALDYAAQRDQRVKRLGRSECLPNASGISSAPGTVTSATSLASTPISARPLRAPSSSFSQIGALKRAVTMPTRARAAQFHEGCSAMMCG